MDTLLATAGDLDNLLDELERNESEQVNSLEANKAHVNNLKSTVAATAVEDQSHSPYNDQTSFEYGNEQINTHNGNGTENRDTSALQSSGSINHADELNHEDKSPNDIEESKDMQELTEQNTQDQTNSSTLMDLFGVVPDYSVNSESEVAPAMLFSPLNPFSASYTGPTTLDGHAFPEFEPIDGIDLIASSEHSNPFANNIGIDTAGGEGVNKISVDDSLREPHQPMRSMDENDMQSQDVADHTSDSVNANQSPHFEMQTDESVNLQPKLINIPHSVEQPARSFDQNSIAPQLEDRVQSEDISSTVDLLSNAAAAVSFTSSAMEESHDSSKNLSDASTNLQSERQEATSMGFMRDLEISKEEFDRFWEQMEEEGDSTSGQGVSNEIASNANISLPHPVTVDPSLPTISSSTDLQPSTQLMDHFHVEDARNESSNATGDLQISVPSTSNGQIEISSSENTPSSEALISPVSVPYTPSVKMDSPTFPLRRKVNVQANQNDLSVEASLRGQVDNDDSRLSLNVDVPVEENVGAEHCYPSTPPPPYSEEMHASFERSTSPTSGSASGQQATDEIQLQREEREDNFTALPSAILESITRPGDTKPVWIPDHDAPQCSNCAQKFTFTRRRHHCRACGRVFCANCCSERAQLKYMEYKEARVCLMCSLAIKQADAIAEQISQQRSRGSAVRMEPPASRDHVEVVGVGEPVEQSSNDLSQAHPNQDAAAIQPSVVPAADNDAPSQNDLQVEGATAGTSTIKSVRFSDGTRPKHPDETPTTPPPPTRTSRSRKRHGATIDQTNFDSTTLPPVIIAHGEDGTFAVQNDPDFNVLLGLLESGNKNPQTFVLNPNLFIHVKFVSHANRQCWCYWSEGMDCVGQREVALVLERQGLGDRQISRDAFVFYKHVFDRARKGKIFNTADYMPKSIMGVEVDEEVFNLERNAGFLFVQATSQSLEGFSCLKRRLYSHSGQSEDSQPIDEPINGMLFAILVQKTEAPLATLFPLRLMLRLGIETKQYPCPLFSIRQRDPVFQEVGHTILAILCDFNHFKYRIIGVPGMRVVLSSNGNISVQIPCNRFRDTLRIMNSSNESVLAIGTGTYGPKATGTNAASPTDAPCDSHLVCVQDEDSTSHHTEISSMKNVKVMNTAAAFVIFNGSLKSDGSHPAKCAIVEDGVMIQLLPEKMEELRSCLKSMEDFTVPLAANPQSIPDLQTSETDHVEQLVLEVKWVDDDTTFNIGMFSPIDGTAFEGVVGFNVQGRSEHKGKKHILRWNQVFFLASTGNPLDLSRLAEQVANGCFLAFTPVIQELVKHKLRKIGVRVTIHPENVGYIAGGGRKDLPQACMNSLDEHLIQTIHNAANSVPVEREAVVFELLFSVLLTKPSYRTA